MNEITKRVHGRIENDTRVAHKMIQQTVVHDKETAELVSKGLLALKEMPQTELEKLQELSVEQIEKGWEDRNVAVMAKAIEANMNMYSDVMTGKELLNPMFTIHRKGLEHLQDPNRLTQTVSNTMEGPETAGIDLGWRRAFNSIAVDAREVQVVNYRMGLRFLEYANRSDRPQPETIGGKTSDKVGPRYFAAAFKHADQEFQTSIVGINQLLSLMRQEALHTQTILAYRAIFANTIDGTSVVGQNYEPSSNKIAWTTSETDQKTIDLYRVFQSRETLNEARRKMIDHASQVSTAKSKKKSIEVPIRVTATDTLLFYLNHAHAAHIAKVQNMTGGDDGVNPILLGNTAFIETNFAPVGGGYKITSKTEDRDDYGFNETVTESFNNNVIGGKLIIPSNLNYFMLFRGLTFLNQRDVMAESDIIGAKFEANTVIDKRQNWHIKLGEY